MSPISAQGNPTTTVDGRPYLVGGRCGECDTHVFPAQRGCPRCGGRMADVALPPTGRVWSCTVQRTQPKPPYRGPAEFVPFAVGYVDLGPVIVETRLEGRDVASWRIGDDVQLTFPPAAGDDEAGPTFWFEPATREGSTR
ncbi:MAG TPA: OB-fold domain-containing protein [Acidimicrobiales bacterium]|jgi:uncharacterized OB-fold protein|nr:OB-fold domain-containing protein [Acidimicrobiales bacterium]